MSAYETEASILLHSDAVSQVAELTIAIKTFASTIKQQVNAIVGPVNDPLGHAKGVGKLRQELNDQVYELANKISKCQSILHKWQLQPNPAALDLWLQLANALTPLTPHPKKKGVTALLLNPEGFLFSWAVNSVPEDLFNQPAACDYKKPYRSYIIVCAERSALRYALEKFFPHKTKRKESCKKTRKRKSVVREFDERLRKLLRHNREQLSGYSIVVTAQPCLRCAEILSPLTPNGGNFFTIYYDPDGGKDFTRPLNDRRSTELLRDMLVPKSRPKTYYKTIIHG